MASFHVIFTVFLFIAFIGICCWAYSRNRQQDFAEAEKLPFLPQEDTDGSS